MRIALSRPTVLDAGTPGTVIHSPSYLADCLGSYKSKLTTYLPAKCLCREAPLYRFGRVTASYILSLFLFFYHYHCIVLLLYWAVNDYNKLMCMIPK